MRARAAGCDSYVEVKADDFRKAARRGVRKINERNAILGHTEDDWEVIYVGVL